MPKLASVPRIVGPAAAMVKPPSPPAPPAPQPEEATSYTVEVTLGEPDPSPRMSQPPHGSARAARRRRRRPPPGGPGRGLRGRDRLRRGLPGAPARSLVRMPRSSMDVDPPRGVLAPYVMTRVRDLAGGDRCPVPLLARPASPVAPSAGRGTRRSPSPRGASRRSGGLSACSAHVRPPREHRRADEESHRPGHRLRQLTLLAGHGTPWHVSAEGPVRSRQGEAVLLFARIFRIFRLRLPRWKFHLARRTACRGRRKFFVGPAVGRPGRVREG